MITKAGLGYEALRIITPKTPKVPKRSQKQQNSTKTTKVHQKTTKTSQNTKKSQKKSQKSHQRHRKSPIDHCNKPEQITVLLFTPADCVWICLDHPDTAFVGLFVRSLGHGSSLLLTPVLRPFLISPMRKPRERRGVDRCVWCARFVGWRKESRLEQLVRYFWTCLL